MVRYKVGDSGIAWELKLVNADNAAIDLTGNTSLFVRFRRPDGTFLTKTAVPKDAAAPGNTPIRFADGGTSILDQWGGWLATAGMVKDGNRTMSAYPAQFWVVG